MHTNRMHKFLALLSLLSLPLMLLVGSAATASAATGQRAAAARTAAVTTSSLGSYAPTFVGPAATGCRAPGCSLLTGPFNTPSTASLATSAGAAAAARQAAADAAARARREAMPDPAARRAGTLRAASAADPVIPTVSCQPLASGCDAISTSPGGAVGVKGLNAVDSASQSTNVTHQDIEPADQGLCAGHGYVIEDNNIGEILVFNTALQRVSAVIPLDTVMGLTSRGWSSGGDISCEYDYADGGHWFFTEIVSASTEASGGPFSGCFTGTVADSCYEGLAVTDGSNPFGPYHVYFVNANFDPAEPGSPYLLNDFAKIGLTRDAFLMFYDEFPLNPAVTGLGGGFFNGAQEYAFSKLALEHGLPASLPNGRPDPLLTVARENMGLLPTPNGTCSSMANPGVDCWAAVIPAQPPDPTQFDNSHGGSGFMLDSLDFNSFAGLPSSGDNRIAAWAWTGLINLLSPGCITCRGIRFSGQLFSGVDHYYGIGTPAPQKAGPIPLGDECGAAGLSVGSPPPASCPEGGIATNGDFLTQVSQADGQLWAATSTDINQTYASGATELHLGAVYWVVGTRSFDSSGVFSLTSQGYVSPRHEDLEFPAIGAEGSLIDLGNNRAIMDFTLSGNGGQTGADNGGFYPSTAFGRLTNSSGGLLGSVIHIADLGQSPQDGFTEYLGYPGPTEPRWGDYSWAIFLPWDGGRVYFATNYIQYPNCLPPAFTLTVGTCSGTRDGFANWGTSVNYAVP